MTITAKQLNYTDKDFDALVLRLQALVRSVFPTWTDFNVANFGNILLELYAQVGNVLGFYQDAQARESRVLTATQRKNLLGLIKLIGYQPKGLFAAQAVETITLDAPPAHDFTLPKGSILSTSDVTNPVEFQLLADLLFPAAMNPPTHTATIENSATQTDTFTSNGLPNQTFQLSRTPYIDGSAVFVASDGTYGQVDNFLNSTSSDKQFTATVDQNDRATLATGNGTNGTIPVGSVTVTYKTGGGALGNVEAGKINRIPGNFVDSMGSHVGVSCTNVGKATGGLDRQSMASIKLLAPQSVRAGDRCVANEDFEIHATEVPGVSRALMTTSDNDPAVPENTGILYIVPTSGGTPTPTLLAAVLTQITITFPSTITFKPSTAPAPYFVVNLAMVLHFKQGANPAVCAALVRANVALFMQPSNADGTPNPNVDFGANYKDENGVATGKLPLADFFNLAENTSGVRAVGGSPSDFLVNGAHADVPIAGRQFPQLGTITIVDGDTGTTL